MAYGNFKDLPRRITSDKLLRDKAFNIASGLNYDGYQLEITSMAYKFFVKKLHHTQEKELFLRFKKLVTELHKLIIRRLKRREVNSSFRDNIWAVDLADISLISKHNKGIRFLLCVIDIYCKYEWLCFFGRQKEYYSYLCSLKKIVGTSSSEPNKILVDKVVSFTIDQ